jgi:hypothetical protein
VYTIDKDGIYRYEEQMPAPGGFETYGGALPMAVWGHGGETNKYFKEVDLLFNLNQSQGWIKPDTITVKDFWNDGGSGPWCCDDGTPYYFGFALGGLKIPQTKKYVLPMGTCPKYDETGNVELTYAPIIDSPVCPKGKDKVIILEGDNKTIKHTVTQVDMLPSSNEESKYLVSDNPVTYKFDVADAIGAAMDFNIKSKNGYKVEVSPDNGARWYKKLDTWSDKTVPRSVDLSFVTGSSDELLEMLVIIPPEDTKYIVEDTGSKVERDSVRLLNDNGSFVYKLDLPQVIECHLEFVLANGFDIQVSKDGKEWKPCTDATKYLINKDNPQEDASWVRLVDVTDTLNSSGSIYVKFGMLPDKTKFNGKNAFLHRVTVLGVLKTNNVLVRVASTSPFADKSVTIEKATFRKWSD